MPEIKVEPKPVLGAPQEDIPPPPPYESKPVKNTKSKNSTQSLYGSNVIKDLPKKDITRPHKFKMESDSSAVLKKKFKKDMEVLDYYQDVVKQKKENHDLVGAGGIYCLFIKMWTKMFVLFISLNNEENDAIFFIVFI